MRTRTGRAARLLAALACLAVASAAGCAGPFKRTDGAPPGGYADDADRHAELEKELSLYSD